MALKKTIETKYGNTASYWRIVQLNISYLGQVSHIELAGYIDEDSRKANKQPIDGRVFDFSGDDFPFNEDEPQNEREIAYNKIKALKTTETTTNEETGETTTTEVDTEFTDAEDC